MLRIFISHSSRDSEEVAELTSRLVADGYHSIFLDFDPNRGIPAGRDWEREIYSKLRESSAVIVVLSRHSMNSRWFFSELTQARAQGKHIFPIRIDDTPIN